MKAKIIGTVFALPPLSNPDDLLRWYIDWKMAQILTPVLLRLGDAMRNAARAVEAFAAAYKEVNSV